MYIHVYVHMYIRRERKILNLLMPLTDSSSSSCLVSRKLPFLLVLEIMNFRPPKQQRNTKKIVADGFWSRGKRKAPRLSFTDCLEFQYAQSLVYGKR